MGGWMDYQRVRARNGLGERKPPSDPDPYPRSTEGGTREDLLILVGDLNRMERDYLDPKYPEPPWAGRPNRSDPATVCADATGVDVETVRKVLRHVFLGT
jgi:hypothetical protein